jgi:hypothetical protein
MRQSFQTRVLDSHFEWPEQGLNLVAATVLMKRLCLLDTGPSLDYITRTVREDEQNMAAPCENA